jgi:hypothetical protein
MPVDAKNSKPQFAVPVEDGHQFPGLTRHDRVAVVVGEDYRWISAEMAWQIFGPATSTSHEPPITDAEMEEDLEALGRRVHEEHVRLRVAESALQGLLSNPGVDPTSDHSRLALIHADNLLDLWKERAR